MPNPDPAPAVHLVLLGDSIIDNAAYLRPGQPDVAAQTAAALPGWWVTRLAHDGAVIADVRERQLPLVPADATHLVISAGGNDLLGQQGILAEPARSVAHGLMKLWTAVEAYGTSYAYLLDVVVRRGLPTVALLPYLPQFDDRAYRAAVSVALAAFHDRMRQAADHFATPEAPIRVVDLRGVCRDPDDFANPIEPSAAGGARIAAAIAAAVTGR